MQRSTSLEEREGKLFAEQTRVWLQYRWLPGGGSSDVVVVVLSENLEQLVEQDRQEANDGWDLLHTEQALEEREREREREKEDNLKQCIAPIFLSFFIPLSSVHPHLLAVKLPTIALTLSLPPFL